jgi:hypothetical protein
VLNAPAAEDGLTALGTPLATIGGEIWLEIAAPAAGPKPLAAVVIYERAPGRTLKIDRASLTPIDLLPHLWDARGDPERTRERFDFVADMVETVALYRLEAPLTTPPSEIAEAVEDFLDRVD